MAESFLSCDNIKVHPVKDAKKEPQPMIVLSTAALSTDDTFRCRRAKPPVPKLCCLVPINAAALFGVASTCFLSVAIYIYSVVILVQTPTELSGTKVIAFLSVLLALILLFAGLFVWGLFTVRQRLLLPFTTLSCFLLFAVIGALIGTMVTSGDEINAALSKAEGTEASNVAGLVIFRAVLLVAAIVLAVKLYTYIRLYLYIRTVGRSSSR